MSDLSQRIEEVAAGPAEVQSDAGRVREQSLEDLVKADQHLAANTAAGKPHRGLRFTRLVPPGTV